MEGAHNDGNRANPYLSNLRWDTRKGNHADKVRHGTQPRGESVLTAKLNETIVAKIRRSQASSRELSETLGVCSSLIRQVRRRVIWKHLP